MGLFVSLLLLMMMTIFFPSLQTPSNTNHIPFFSFSFISWKAMSDGARGGGPKTVDLSRLTPEQLVRIVESAEEAVARGHADAKAAAATPAPPPRRRGRARVRVQEPSEDAGSEAGDEASGDEDAQEEKARERAPLLRAGPRRALLVALLALLLAVLFAPYAAAARERGTALAHFVSSGLSRGTHTRRAQKRNEGEVTGG